jgi:hypothetical protein
MSKDRIAQDVQELRGEAAEARQFAATFDDGSAVRDLLSYASALEREAAQLEKATDTRENCSSLGRSTNDPLVHWKRQSEHGGRFDPMDHWGKE